MQPILRHLRVSVETMSPGYFSMVMATGILSLAAHLMQLPLLARMLFGLNCALFAGTRRNRIFAPELFHVRAALRRLQSHEGGRLSW